jgi:hypothetical protein
MKTKEKQLQLIKYGLKPSTVTNLNESQVSNLFKRLIEVKTDTKEQILVKDPKKAIEMQKMDPNAKIEVPETEMNEDDALDQLAGIDPYAGNTPGNTDGPTGDGDIDSIQEDIKKLLEKYESKKQQKYFYSKCGDGKTKEQKKWCAIADEFSSKTNFKKLPEKKKKENNESMSNYMKKVGSSYAGGIKSKLKDININPTFGESELEKHVLTLVEKYITPKMTKKEFLSLVREQGVKTAPVKPDVDTPTRPSKPATPYKPKPGVKPAPKAKRKSIPNWLTFDEIGIKLK